MLCHIHAINQSWGSMLAFYGDLNNARKEEDLEYVQKQGIGEETQEPDDSKF